MHGMLLVCKSREGQGMGYCPIVIKDIRICGLLGQCRSNMAQNLNAHSYRIIKSALHILHAWYV